MNTVECSQGDYRLSPGLQFSQVVKYLHFERTLIYSIIFSFLSAWANSAEDFRAFPRAKIWSRLSFRQRVSPGRNSFSIETISLNFRSGPFLILEANLSVTFMAGKEFKASSTDTRRSCNLERLNS